MTTAPGTPGRIVLDDARFDRLARVVREQLGIALGRDKRPLLEARLIKVMAGVGAASVDALFARHLDGGEASDELLSQLVDHVTTSHSHFHREPTHFTHLRATAIPAALARRSRERDVRIWCAAAATGQEPYELAMVLREAMAAAGLSGWLAGVLATDVSARALELARQGRYAADDAERLPQTYRETHLHKEADGRWRIRPSLAQDVTFRRLNLLEPAYPFRRAFDAVFCRNVLMYFDPETRRQVVLRIVDVLAPGAFLYVGQAESLNGLGLPLSLVGPGIYRAPALLGG